MNQSITLVYDPASDKGLERVTYVSSILTESGYTCTPVPIGDTFCPTLLGSSFDLCILVDVMSYGRSQDLQSLLGFLGKPYLGTQAKNVRFCYDSYELNNVMNDLALSGQTQIANEQMFTFTCSNFCSLGVLPCLSSPAFDSLGGFPLSLLLKSPDGTESAKVIHSEEELLSTLGDVQLNQQVATLYHASEGVRVWVGVVEYDDDVDVLPPLIKRDANDSFAVAKETDLDAAPEEGMHARSSLERAARQLFDICGCEGYALFELIWDGAQVHIASIDCTPQLGADSAFALACAQASLSYSQILRTMVEEQIGAN